MTTKLVQSVNENDLSLQRKNQRLAFSACSGVIHSQRTRELPSTWSHHSAALREGRALGAQAWVDVMQPIESWPWRRTRDRSRAKIHERIGRSKIPRSDR